MSEEYSSIKILPLTPSVIRFIEEADKRLNERMEKFMKNPKYMEFINRCHEDLLNLSKKEP